MKNNKGFSLVELIIVIAIMAILVGVMAPQLIKYIEKTNVSSDSQLCDSVKTAIQTAMMDPTILSTDSAGVTAKTAAGWKSVRDLDASVTDNPTTFSQAVAEILGFNPKEIESHIKSAHGANARVQYNVVNGTGVHVCITYTDKTGKKTTNTDALDKIIYVD